MFHRILKWVLWLTGLLFIMLILVAAGLFFTPNMVSTDWFRHQFETRSSKALNRHITVNGLQWTWKEGIRIKGLEVADDPKYAKAPLLSIDQLLFSFDLEFTRKRLFIDLEVDSLKAHLIREKDGHTNLEAWLAKLKPPPEPTKTTQDIPKEKKSSSPFILPGDLEARIQLNNVDIQVDDRMDKHLLHIHDGTFRLDIPSLLSKPVTLALSSRQVVDGKILPPLELTVHVDRLVDETRALNLEAAFLQLNGELPGLNVALKGSMAQKGLEGRLEIDFVPLVKAVQPFMPAAIPELSGRILFQANARLQADNAVAFDLVLACEDFLIAGGPLKAKRIGPLSFDLIQKGGVNPRDRIVNLDSGEIRLMEKSGLSFEGRVKLEEKTGANVNLTLHRVTLDLNEIQNLVKGFIPKGIHWNGLNHAHRPDFEIKEVHLSGMLPGGEARLSVKDLALNVSSLGLQLSEDNLKAEDLTLQIPYMAVQLKNLFPKGLEIHANLGAKNVRISGKQTIELDSCRISSLNLTIKDLLRSPDALWGMAGRISIQESGSIRGIRLPPHNDGTPLLEHGFKADIFLPSEPKARVIFAEINLSTAALKMAAVSPHPLKDGLTLKGHVKDALLTDLNPLMLDVGELDADIQSGDLLVLHIKGAALDSGMKEFQTGGSLGVDLKQAVKLIPAALKPAGRFTGRMETDWRLQGRRPTAKELAGLSGNTLSLEKRLRHTDFLEKLDLKTRFINMGMALPLESGETLSVQGIHSSGPLKISASNGLESISFEGKINFDKIQALPSLGKLKTPLSAGLSLKAVCRDLNSLELWETLQVAHPAVKQTLELSLNKLKRLLKRRDKPDLASLLKLLEARVKAEVAVNMGPGLAPFSQGLALEGPLKGRLELQLRGGKTVSLRTFLESEGLNVALPSKLTINNLKTHLQLEKTYRLALGPQKTANRENTKALSLTVLEPRMKSGTRSGFNNPLSQRLVDDLRGRLSRKPTLSFDSAWLEKGPFPLELNNARFQMRFNQSLPSVDYLQMDVMGGTLLGEVRIFERHGLYFLQMDGAFSGLDVETRHALSLQGRDAGGFKNQKAGGEDTQVSGQMSFQIPISPNAGTVMNNLNAVFRLTHIGARTLERLLYAMDPHENNERIVQQRALLRKGSPRWIEVAIRHGNLSLTGEVEVGGSRINLPPIKRLNVAALPIQKRIQNLGSRLVPLVKGLKILSADTLRVKPGGAIDFVQKR